MGDRLPQKPAFPKALSRLRGRGANGRSCPRHDLWNAGGIPYRFAGEGLPSALSAFSSSQPARKKKTLTQPSPMKMGEGYPPSHSVIPDVIRDPASSFFFDAAKNSGIPDQVRDDVEYSHHG